MYKIALLTFFISFTGQTTAQQGLVAEYFDSPNFEKKVATRIDPFIDFHWKIPPVFSIKSEKYSVRWTGKIKAPESGVYPFSVTLDGTIRVWIGNKLIINVQKMYNEISFSFRIHFEKGKTYDIKVEYSNKLRKGEVYLFWGLPSMQPKQENTTVMAIIDNQYFLLPNKPNRPKIKPQNNKLPLSKGVLTDSKKPKIPPIVAFVVNADTIQKYTPKNVMFQQSKSLMLPKSYEELDKLTIFLKQYPKLTLTIEGHTDVIGDSKMNKVLSEERALAVAQYLIRHGIDENRIVSVGYGSSRPLVADSVKTGNSVNRRVVFMIK